MLTHKPQIEMVATSALIPYARNAKQHDDAQVAKLAGSIREYGFTNPVLIDADNGIIAGHGRVMGAQKLGLGEVPCIRLSHLTETQRRAYVLADNRLAEIGGGWDADMLRIEVEELREAGVDLDGIGLDAASLAELMPPPDQSNEGNGEPDEVPEAPLQPVSVVGDVWVMGKHRMICGSSTEAAVVDKVLAGANPHLMVTDPPYGVEYDPKWRLEAGINKAHQKRAEGVVMNDDRSDWREAWALFPGAVAYVWHGALHAANVAESLMASGFEIRSQIIWAKSSLVMGRGHYHWQHEPCWYAARGTASWAGDRKQSTLWQIQNMHRTQGNVDDGKTNHSTQKPIECMKRPIENNSVAGDHIYEPFSGSGTTIIAGEMTGRHVHAIELNPAYVDIAVTRWQTFTGMEAVNEATGLTFAATKAKMEGE